MTNLALAVLAWMIWERATTPGRKRRQREIKRGLER